MTAFEIVSLIILINGFVLDVVLVTYTILKDKDDKK